MINTYDPNLDRKAWCPKLDFHLLQDAALITCLANFVVCFALYVNMVGYPIFAIGEENKDRGYRMTTLDEWIEQEITDFHFRYTLFDVVLLLFIKIIIIMSVWSVGPYLSQASTLSSLAHIPEKFAMLCLLYFVMKAILFDVQAYIPDIDKRGEENYEGAADVGEWAERDGEIVAAQDRSHENLKQSSVALLVICVILTFIEACCQRDANRRERKYKRFLVHPDRCPICTQPIGMCNHKNQFGLDVIRNWHYGFCDCFESLGVTVKTFCCCCCCCIQGNLAAAYSKQLCPVYCCMYCVSCWLCCPLGVHACIGCWTRYANRRKNQITGTLTRDFFSHWCCCCCALIQEARQLHADKFVQNEFKVRKTEDELAAEQLKVTAPPKISFGMFQGDIVAHRRRDGVLEYRVHWQGKPKDEDDWFIRNQLIEEFPDVVVEYERINGI